MNVAARNGLRISFLGLPDGPLLRRLCLGVKHCFSRPADWHRL
ncbi:hypothetical protein DFR29_11252 [Tahibacter aquaticus]|uniref:Uncharacterized protein n=1 Tax=Tahibacter aquaticus TaxID=520092 RepID=A0A4R6YRZ4_9GAMM|nr:hypothetical protein DFR29_11252 [Tahibacter aquaticus]